MEKLIKVAKELNVGTQTIVEYLANKGFELDNKPNAKVTDEMYNELRKEFQKSIAIKEQANQLTFGTRHGSEQPGSREGVATVTAERSTTPPPVVPNRPDTSAPATTSTEEKIERERPTLSRPKVLGKIDLGNRLKGRSKGTPPEPTPAEAEPPQEKSPAVKEPTPDPAPVVTPPKAQPAPADTASPESPAAAPATKAPAEPTAPTEATEQKPVPKPAEPAAPAAKEDAPADAKPSNKTTVEPVNMHIRAEAPELRGLKVLGKIELKPPTSRRRGGKDTTTDKKTDAKPATGTTANTDSKRGKRKRVRKKVTPGQVPRPSGGGPDANNRRGAPPPRGRRGREDESKEVSSKEIEEKIKATMARMQGGGKKRRQRMRRDNRERLRERQEQREMDAVNDKLEVTEFISVQELANLMNVPATDVIMTLMNAGVIVSINQRLDAEIIELIASEFDHEVEFIGIDEQDDDFEEYIDDEADLLPRPPIITVMGHVDHGKTSLLDYIRETNVVGGEAGGITQHVGAYEVTRADGRQITFLDTPGHEAFTAMRARGAKVTDIAIIVVAADDSIMPQTKEAISHAEAAAVPIVFAINKIDKAGANPERIKQELASMNYMVEEWGGKYQSQDISALQGIGIDELLEKVLLEAEMLELKANPDRPAVATVLEASLEKGRGYVAKALVQTGTLRIGDSLVAGENSGRVKAMFNERNKRVKEAGPSSPVLILGLDGAPQAGEAMRVMESESDARQVASKRAQIVREQATRATKRISLDEIGRRLALGNFKELNLIVKGDVDGSIEALSDSLIKLSQETVQVNVIHKAVGQIIESDILLASASDAIVIGFQVRPSPSARRLAEQEGVQIKMYSIIYEAIEEIKSAIEGMLEPTREEKIIATVEVREVFKVSKVGTVAGCYVEEGKITRSTPIRLIRDGIVVYPTREGVVAEIDSLKRFKDDVKEVRNGMECGISIKNFNDIKIGDIIEGYEVVETKQTLA